MYNFVHPFAFPISPTNMTRVHSLLTLLSLSTSYVEAVFRNVGLWKIIFLAGTVPRRTRVYVTYDFFPSYLKISWTRTCSTARYV